MITSLTCSEFFELYEEMTSSADATLTKDERQAYKHLASCNTCAGRLGRDQMIPCTAETMQIFAQVVLKN